MLSGLIETENPNRCAWDIDLETFRVDPTPNKHATILLCVWTQSSNPNVYGIAQGFCCDGYNKPFVTFTRRNCIDNHIFSLMAVRLSASESLAVMVLAMRLPEASSAKCRRSRRVLHLTSCAAM